MSKRFLLILAALVLIFFGVIIFTKQSKKNDSGSVNSGGSNHIVGSSSSGVALVEFGDFQCPACASYHPILKEIKTKYAEQITFQFRHFPLVGNHQNAMAAHRAAEAAGKQDRFWEMHDMLYERQKTWEQSNNAAQIFEDYATELGINIDQYHQDIASSTINEIINADIKAAQAIGANSTPTFAINGRKINSPGSLEDFSKLIDEEIAKTQVSE